MVYFTEKQGTLYIISVALSVVISAKMILLHSLNDHKYYVALLEKKRSLQMSSLIFY